MLTTITIFITSRFSDQTYTISFQSHDQSVTPTFEIAHLMKLVVATIALAQPSNWFVFGATTTIFFIWIDLV